MPFDAGAVFGRVVMDFSPATKSLGQFTGKLGALPATSQIAQGALTQLERVAAGMGGTLGRVVSGGLGILTGQLGGTAKAATGQAAAFAQADAELAAMAASGGAVATQMGQWTSKLTGTAVAAEAVAGEAAAAGGALAGLAGGPLAALIVAIATAVLTLWTLHKAFQAIQEIAPKVFGFLVQMIDRGIGSLDRLQMGAVEMAAAMRISFPAATFEAAYGAATQLLKVVETLGARFSGTGEDLQQMAKAMVNLGAGVFVMKLIGANAEGTRKQFVALAEAIKAQNSELAFQSTMTATIRSIMTGTVRQGALLVVAMRNAGLDLKKVRQEFLAGELSAKTLEFLQGYVEASGKLSGLLSSMRKEWDNIVNRLLRDAVQQIYPDLVGWQKKLNGLIYDQHGNLTKIGRLLSGVIQYAWWGIRTTANMVLEFIKDMYPDTKTWGDALGRVADHAAGLMWWLGMAGITVVQIIGNVGRLGKAIYEAGMVAFSLVKRQPAEMMKHKLAAQQAIRDMWDTTAMQKGIVGLDRWISRIWQGVKGIGTMAVPHLGPPAKPPVDPEKTAKATDAAKKAHEALVKAFHESMAAYEQWAKTVAPEKWLERLEQVFQHHKQLLRSDKEEMRKWVDAEMEARKASLDDSLEFIDRMAHQEKFGADWALQQIARVKEGRQKDAEEVKRLTGREQKDAYEDLKRLAEVEQKYTHERYQEALQDLEDRKRLFGMETWAHLQQLEMIKRQYAKSGEDRADIDKKIAEDEMAWSKEFRERELADMKLRVSINQASKRDLLDLMAAELNALESQGLKASDEYRALAAERKQLAYEVAETEKRFAQESADYQMRFGDAALYNEIARVQALVTALRAQESALRSDGKRLTEKDQQDLLDNEQRLATLYEEDDRRQLVRLDTLIATTKTGYGLKIALLDQIIGRLARQGAWEELLARQEERRRTLNEMLTVDLENLDRFKERLGRAFYSPEQAMKQTRDALQGLLAQYERLGAGAEVLKPLRDQLREIDQVIAQQAWTLQNVLLRAWGDMQSSLSDFFYNAFEQAKSWGDLWKDLWYGIARSFQRIFADMIANFLMEQLGGALRSILGMTTPQFVALGAGAATAGVAVLAANTAMAAGIPIAAALAGTLTTLAAAYAAVSAAAGGVGAGVPAGDLSGLLAIPGFAQMQHGGVVTEPTLALLGETGPEAVVPLGAVGTGGGDVHFHINALDTQTGVEFLMRNRKEVAKAIFGAQRDMHRARGGPKG
jgi:arsenate reductase-like glutaredoxin family protein